MQEPLENLSPDARLVHAQLTDESVSPETIVERIGGQLHLGEVADALRELEAAERAAQTFGGWAVLR